jgi:glycosyltransferase involved in cell wall biosynthesis
VRARALARTRRWAQRVDALPAVGKVKFRLKRLLGQERARALKRRVPGLGGPPPAEGGDGATPIGELAITRFGVNVQGYARTESGMGEGVRGVLRALASAGIPYSLHNLELNVRSRMEDRSFEAFEGGDEFDVNVMFVNADQVPQIARHLGRERLRRRYNVGCWSWELEEFPPEWRGSFGYFHEIWTPSTFCLESIAAVSPVPVRRLPHAVEFEPPADLARSDLGLPADRFVFVFVFDYLSFTERKNPLGLVRAFKRAFGPGDGAVLVLKTINSEFDPEGAALLAREAAGHPVVFLDRYLTRREVHGLLALADCCVSLHRSEGFGLTLAEAMVLGKPVVATAYSGNTDFMNPGNSFPVRYRLVPIERDHGPYRAGWRWAEPDEEHAAEQMRAVFADREAARRIAERGREDVRRELSNAAVGRLLRRRLERIVEQVNGPGRASLEP